MKKRSRRKSSLGAWVLGAESPLFLLNVKRKVLFFNKGCEQLTGWLAVDVVGQICDYMTEADCTLIESVTGVLCPPPEVLAGKVCSVPAFFAHREGTSQARLIHFFPLFDAQEKVESVLGMVTQIDQPIQTTPPTLTDQLHAEFASLRLQFRRQYRMSHFLGHCNAMRRVMRQVQTSCTTNIPLLISGEAGTGKQFIARLLHQEGRSHQQSFVPFDTQQLPPRDLLRTLKRLFETMKEASDLPIARLPGTIYLADVDCITRDVQQLIIDNQALFSDQNQLALRLLAGTTCQLQELLIEEKIIPEFYYLITTQEIFLPALRQRDDDLKLLAQHFLEQLNRGAEHQVTGFDKAVWLQFKQYHWQGNLRELYEVIREARASCQTLTIQTADLPFRFQTGRDAQAISPPTTSSVIPLDDLLEQQEKNAILQALQQANHNKTIAAELLNIPRARLYRRMEALSIENTE